MFQKVLVANRGEIAVRVMRTCQRLGIKTLAVHSEIDADHPFVRLADQAVCIGPAPVAESYLRGDEILRVALEHGADAIHPGYGLLSENAAFAEAVEAAGLTFIGPSAESMRLMGSKVRAREVAVEAGLRSLYCRIFEQS